MLPTASELKFREVPLEDLVDLRRAVLTPGHPNRPVVRPYDHNQGAVHLGGFYEGRLVTCVSSDMCPLEASDPSTSYRFHSMAVAEDWQRQGVGTQILDYLVGTLANRGAVLLWATARRSALGFYEHLGMDRVGSEVIVPETGFPVYYVTLDVAEYLTRPRPSASGSATASAPSATT